MNQLTNFSYGTDKAKQMLNSFSLESLAAEDTIEKAVKGGKLDTSHLVLKDVMVNGKVAKRWVNPSTGQEHAKHGSQIHFDHKGEKKAGVVGSVMSTGEYSIKASDGRSYAKHPHQFVSPHVKGSEGQEAEANTTAGQSSAGSHGEHPNIAGKTVSSTELEELDEEAEDLDINAKFKVYEKFVRMVAKGTVKSGIAYGSGGVGKAMPLYSKILTPNGFSTMGVMEIGSEIITPKGNISKVIGVFPQGIRPVYELTFIDGSKARADEEHLWKIWDRRLTSKGSGEWKLYTTKQLIEFGVKNKDKRGWGWNFGTPFIENVYQSKDIDLPIHPYLLGFLLGDGCFKGGVSFTVGIRDKIHILTKLCKLIPKEKDLSIRRTKSSLKESGTASYGISQKNGGGIGNGPLPNILTGILKELKLYDLSSYEKHLPEIYKTSSPRQKLELIQGLMDSDGYVMEGGCTSFGSTSYQLAKDFYDLVKSFGGFGKFKNVKEKFYKHKGELRLGRAAFEVVFTLPNGLIPVTLPFKTERYESKKHYSQALSIIDIKYIGEEETKCILIDDPEHLYITDNYIVTHNTFSALQVLQTTINPKTKKIFVEYDPDKHAVGTDDYDYVKITGKATTSGVVQAMWEHNGKMLLFDDCDTALTQPDTIMIFKGALDSTGDGKISTLSQKPLKDADGLPIPQTFKFNGRAFFISNLKGNQIDQAIKSRSLRIDLSMTVDQTIQRIKAIARNKEGKSTNIKLYDTDGSQLSYTHDDMEAAIQFLEKYKNKTGDLNIRTLGNVVRVIHEGKEEGETEHEWKDAAKSFILAKSVETEIEELNEPEMEKSNKDLIIAEAFDTMLNSELNKAFDDLLNVDHIDVKKKA